MHNSWVDKFNALIEKNVNELITEKKFNDIILDLCNSEGSPYYAIQFEVYNLKSKQIVKKYGCNKEFSIDISETIPLNHFWNCTLKAWKNPEINNIEVKIKDLFLSFWKEDCRDKKTYITSTQIPKAAMLCQKFIATTSEFPYTVFAFGDLDRFKQVNDFMGMEEGDRVIAELGIILADNIDNEGVVIHISGDEFVIVYRCSLLEDALLSLYNITKYIKKHDFKLIATKSGRDERNDEDVEEGKRIDINITFGVTYFTNEEAAPSWDELFRKAENTMSKKQVNGFKGTTRISHYQDKFNQQTLQNFDYKTAYILAKANIDTVNPFSNVWLNTLSLIISSMSADNDLDSEVNYFTSWLKNDYIEGISFFGNEIQILLPQFSATEVIMAISHGLARRSSSSQIIWRIQDKKISLVHKAKPDIMESFEKEHVFISEENALEIQNLLPFDFWAKRAILIQIGHKKSPIPTSLFAETIIVDDRPTKGGALPDFWERVLAQLIFIINNNKNITHLVIYGEKANGRKTIQLLSEIGKWDSEYIQWLSEKTKRQISQINEIKKRLSDSGDNIIVEDDLQVLIDKLFELYVCTRNFTLANEIHESFSSRILSRNAILEDGNKLQNYDGIRIATISEAYPIMLDIVRSMKDDNKMLHLFDQAGQEFLELTDFKVHLTNPTADMVPFFFAKRDQEYLENYYNAAFETDGLFFRELNTNQYEQVIKHLVETISDVKKRFSTRRAILVIPHSINENIPLSPLGLVSVRIMPTFEGKTVKLNYSCTWRTVEAVIGFPYSIYGSVKFSNSITEDIRQRIEKINPSINIKIGTVSYIAHSLHMFTDTYTQEIIRGIINDASK